MSLGWWWWQFHHLTVLLQQGLVLTQKYWHWEGGGSLPPSSLALVLLAKARGIFRYFSPENFQVIWFEGHRIPHRVKDAKGLFLQKGFCEAFPGYFIFWLSLKSRVHWVAGAPGGTRVGWNYSSKWHHQQGLDPEPSVPLLLPELREQHLW